MSLPPPSLPNYFKRQKRYVPIKIHGGAERLIHTSRKRQSRLSERSANYFQRQSRRKQAAAYNKLCRRFFDFSPSQTCHDLLFPLPARVRACRKFSWKNIFLTVTHRRCLPATRAKACCGSTKLKFSRPGNIVRILFRFERDKTSGGGRGGGGDIGIGSSCRERNTIMPGEGRNCTLEEEIYRRWKVVCRVFSCIEVFFNSWKTY